MMAALYRKPYLLQLNRSTVEVHTIQSFQVLASFFLRGVCFWLGFENIMLVIVFLETWEPSLDRNVPVSGQSTRIFANVIQSDKPLSRTNEVQYLVICWPFSSLDHMNEFDFLHLCNLRLLDLD